MGFTCGIGAFITNLGGECLAHDDLRDLGIHGVVQLLVQIAGACLVAAAKHLDRGAVRDGGHGILHHAAELCQQPRLLLRRSPWPVAANKKRHGVFLDKFDPETQTALFKHHRPETPRQQPQSVGVIVGGKMAGNNKLAKW